MDDRGLYWLASYPKSGNTWFRIFLTHILNQGKDGLTSTQEALIGTGSAASFLMDRVLGFDCKLLPEDELARLRPIVYNWYGQQPGVRYFKIHDAYCTEHHPLPIIPKENTRGIIYFIRNPLDVVISFAHHMNCSIDEAINMMNYPLLALRGTAPKPHAQVRQVCSSWSMHVASWLDSCCLPVLVIRYEDMHRDPLATFSHALEFLHCSAPEEVVRTALDKSQFNKLKKEEEQFGFKESAGLERVFFRKGIVGDWKTTLTKQQIQRIIMHHQAMMSRFGYLDEAQQWLCQETVDERGD